MKRLRDGGIMGVLSSFRQLDEKSVKLWSVLTEEKWGGDGGIELEIAGRREVACSLNVYCLG